MCGFVALLAKGMRPVSPGVVRNALDRMYRRGPDGEGQWHEPGVAMGHRRLAILDLDARAAQPMQSACGRYVIVFNGEIYNFRDLRRGLAAQGLEFKTTSDTEVLLWLFSLEGEAMLPKLHGMFAFVIWDRVARRGFVARDPYGIKPLYVAETAEGVIVGSQVKALRATGAVSAAGCARGRAGYWMLGSVPEPYTWFRDIRALKAGHCAWIEDGRIRRLRQWHDVGKAWREARPEPASSSQGVEAELRHALFESVRRHLVSDVPVGIFLSGGVDSGSLAGLMIDAGGAGIEGVTLAYDEFSGKAVDEAPMASAIARHYGLRHTVRHVGREEFLVDLPRILDAMDQPSIDGVNTWYASKAVAERGLKVAVSGVGGDELFQGYGHFRSLPRLLRFRQRTAWMPGVSALLQGIGDWQGGRSDNPRWHHLEEWTRTIEGAWWLRRSIRAPEDLHVLMGDELAREVLDDFDVVEQVRAMAGELPDDPILALGQIESATYLRNQLLRDSDWASMDHSVELRTPLVDVRLLQQAQRWLALLGRLSGKGLLSRAPARPLPRFVLRREKSGFGIPVTPWLYGRELPLGRSWAVHVATAYGSAS